MGLQLQQQVHQLAYDSISSPTLKWIPLNVHFTDESQLKDATAIDQFNATIKNFYTQNDKDADNELFLHPLAKWHLYNDFENGKPVGGKIDQLVEGAAEHRG